MFGHRMTYFANVNPDLLRFIPLTAARVLEIGCGEGALAAEYRRRNPKAEYIAIETHGPSASRAAEHATRLIEGDFEAMDDAEIADLGRFDAIVMGDVLEHMADPDHVLSRLHVLLAADGHLILSVPNVAHWSALFHLMNGRWPSEDSGLFDRTHLRFFTLHSLKGLLARTGFAMVKGLPRQFLLDKDKASSWIPALADLAERMGLNREDFVRRASALQYVIVGQKADRPAQELMHLRTAVFAPAILEARTNLPADYLDSVPGLLSSKDLRTLNLPKLPAETPKIVIVQRHVPVNEARWMEWLIPTMRAGWVVVSEWDDHPDLIAEATGAERDAMWTTIRLAHAVQTSTDALAAAFRAENAEVAPFANAAFTLGPAPERKVTPPRVFFGAANREAFSTPVARSFAALLAAHPEIQFEVVHDRAFFEALPTASKTFHPTLPYADYLKVMESCDIALLPLEGRNSELFKSDIKYVEAGSRGLAVIASPATYGETIEHGVTGLIADDIDAWAPALLRLIDEPVLRHTLASDAWREVRDHRMFADQIGERHRWYADLWRRRKELQRDLLARNPELARLSPSV